MPLGFGIVLFAIRSPGNTICVVPTQLGSASTRSIRCRTGSQRCLTRLDRCESASAGCYDSLRREHRPVAWNATGRPPPSGGRSPRSVPWGSAPNRQSAPADWLAATPRKCPRASCATCSTIRPRPRWSMGATLRLVPLLLPPTHNDLLEPLSRPYFLWWTGATVSDFQAHLRSTDAEERAYWTAALLREANTRDVWLFVRPDEVRAQWPRLLRYLGRSRDRWAYLLGLEPSAWPPEAARVG